MHIHTTWLLYCIALLMSWSLRLLFPKGFVSFRRLYITAAFPVTSQPGVRCWTVTLGWRGRAVTDTLSWRLCAAAYVTRREGHLLGKGP